MPLQPGDKLGFYEILAPLGAGGVGEVYRAQDTKLGREVAIKILPAAFAQDANRLACFKRDARVLAVLNHPNIAQVYGLENSNGAVALVRELVPGSTLKGPLPLDTALDYAGQIAEALEAAHEKIITHRGLKPANIVVTAQGVVKVLDFGLAAVNEPRVVRRGDRSQSPANTMRAIQVGMLPGMAAYTSPERVRGQSADRRGDIWALGVILYEMLTGKQLFQADTISDILASVLKEEPALEQVPAQVRLFLRRCLEKDPTRRLQDIGDWDLLIREEAAPDPSQVTALLKASASGDTAARERLAALISAEYRHLARHYMRKERSGFTLQTMKFATEVYLRLVDVRDVDLEDRGYFFAVYAQVTRRILVEAANARAGRDAILAIDEALKPLAEIDPRKARVFEMRYFCGLSVEEIAEALGIPLHSVLRDWKHARAWLSVELTQTKRNSLNAI